MNPLKQLAGQTAIYGLGTIVPRLLNYLLVPLYTRILIEHDYGIITELYAYIAFFLVILTYGMETTFFRFSEKKGSEKTVFNNTVFSVFSTSVLFVLVLILFKDSINGFLHYDNHPNIILFAGIIVAMDAFTSILFAYLRKVNKALRFSLIKLINVGMNLGFNLFFLLLCPQIIKTNPDSILINIYRPGFEIEYILISNLVASITSLLLLLPYLLKFKLKPDFKLLRQMFKYTLPLLIVGVAGMINEVGDKIVFKYLISVPDHIQDARLYTETQLGIYGANFKLGILMMLFVQMFRYAFEPFFFSQSKNKDARQIYADVMKYFIIFCLIIFLGVSLYIDVFKYFIGERFRGGLHIVPIVLMAKLFLGIFVNLSIWYKLKDLTKYGAVIALIGAALTILFNIILVPLFGYTGSASSHLMVYFTIMMISYFWGLKHYPINYDLKRIGLYFLLAMIIFLLNQVFSYQQAWLKHSINALFILIFIGITYLFEKKHIRKIINQ